MKRVLVLIAILSPIGPYRQAAPAQADWPMFIGDGDRTAIQDGRVYLIVGVETDQLVVVDANSGRVISKHPTDRAHAPYPMEDRLLLYRDRAHTDPVVASWWSLDGQPTRRRTRRCT